MALARSGAGFVLCIVAVSGCARFGYDPLQAKAQIVESDADVGTTDGQGGNVNPSDDAGSGLMDTEVVDVLAPPDVTESPDVVSDAGSDALDEASDAPPPSTGVVIDLSDPLAMLRNGATKINGMELDLVTGDYFQAGSAYLPTPYPIGPTTTFSIAFSFRIYGGDGVGGADGFTLVWQNAGPTALGTAGSSLGYASTVTPSVAVEFDTYKTAGNDLNDNHLRSGHRRQRASGAGRSLDAPVRSQRRCITQCVGRL
jgi:hypothetical protein